MGVFAAVVTVALVLGRRWRLSTIPAVFSLGLLLGRPGIHILSDETLLAPAMELGLLLTLFFTGLFANPKAIKEGGGAGLPLAGYHLALNFAGAWWIGTFLGWATPDKLFLAGILAASSTAVVMKILGDENRITKREGNVLVSLLLIEDWILLGFYGFLAFRFAGNGFPLTGPEPLWLIAFAAFLLSCRLARRAVWSVPQREAQVALLTALGVFGAYLGGQAGLPVVGAAFTTGLFLSAPATGPSPRRDPAVLREAAAAIFFVSYGATLGPSLSWSLLPLLGLCVASILLTDLAFLPVLARRLGLRRSESYLTGAILLARGGKSAAFAKLHPATAGAPALFPLAGLLSVALTPLTPLLVRIGLFYARRPSRLAFQSAGESFSRSARALLLPDRLARPTPRSGWSALVTLAWTLAAVATTGFVLLATGPARLAGAAAAIAVLVGLYRRVRERVRVTLGPATPDPRTWRSGPGAYRGHGLPLLVAGPVALIVLLVLLAPWAQVAYPALLLLLFAGAVSVPWVRQRQGARAPPLERALASRSRLA